MPSMGRGFAPVSARDAVTVVLPAFAWGVPAWMTAAAWVVAWVSASMAAMDAVRTLLAGLGSA